MRLLNARTKKLELWHGDPYAIVSHRWGAESEEVLFIDINDLSHAKTKERGYKKIDTSCSMALSDGLSYVWIDTCCIDKRNEKELTTAINSMYEWYQGSKICYAYLHDVGDISEFTRSEWFLRGWTLQELIAPRELKFFAKDWTLLGTREELIQSITECTEIKSEILLSSVTPHNVSIAQRMFWAAKRATTEEEDKAYSLLGLFDIHLPAIYGIKQKAFQELQFKMIMSKSPDKSLFAWKLISNAAVSDPHTPSSITGLLAASPSQYLNAYEIPCEQFYRPFGSKRLSRWECFSLKNGAVCVTLPIRQIEQTSVHEALLRCSLDPPQNPPQTQRPLVVYLKRDNRHGRFARVHDPTSLHSLEDDSTALFELEKVYVDEVSHRAPRNLEPRVQTPCPLPRNADPNSATMPSDAGSYEHATDTASANNVAPPSIQTHLSSDSFVTSTLNNENDPGDENTQFSVHTIQASDSGPTEVEGSVSVPPRCPLINIIVCGEPGAGAGGVVNLVAAKAIVDSRMEFKRAPMTFTTHDIPLDSRTIRIFYTIGPRDHLLNIEEYHQAIKSTEELAQSLRDDGGVRALFCCMSRTKPNHNIHCLFYEALCGQSVPVIVLGTGFSSLVKNLQVDLTGIRHDAYANISVVPSHVPEKSDDYERSVETVRKLVIEHTNSSRKAYLPHVGRSVSLVLKEFLSASAKRALTHQLSNESMHISSGPSDVESCLPSPLHLSPHHSLTQNSSVSMEQNKSELCPQPATLAPQVEHNMNDSASSCMQQSPIISTETIPIQTSPRINPQFATSTFLHYESQPHKLIESICSPPSCDSKGKKRVLTSDGNLDAGDTRPRKQAVAQPNHNPVYIAHVKSDEDPGINYLVFSSDGQQLAVVCNDHTVRIWNVQSIEETARLAQNVQVTSVAWMSDDMGVISLGQDGVISMWIHTNQNHWQRVKFLDAGNADSICFACRHDRIAVAFPLTGISVWILIEGTWQSKRLIQQENVTSIRFVEDGEALIGGTSDGVLWYCQVSNGMLCIYTSLKAEIYYLDVNKQGTHALVSQVGGRAHLVGIQQTSHKGKIEQVYSTYGDGSGDQRQNFGAVFAGGCKMVLFGSTNGNLMVWDTFKGEVMCRLDHGKSKQVQAVACVDYDSRTCIVTGTKCGVLSWWEPPLMGS